MTALGRLKIVENAGVGPVLRADLAAYTRRGPGTDASFPRRGMLARGSVVKTEGFHKSVMLSLYFERKAIQEAEFILERIDEKHGSEQLS